MFRVALEGIAGLKRCDECFASSPCLPPSWPLFTIEWRFQATLYSIRVENPDRRGRGVASVMLDGLAGDARAIPLIDDGGTHHVRVVLGASIPAPSPAPARASAP